MIDRYSRPKMKKVWSEENKYDKWLAVELAVCEAWTEAGVIPQDDMAKLRHASYDPVRLNEIFQRTRHDMTAFTRSITENLGEEGPLDPPGTYLQRRTGHVSEPAAAGSG